MSSSRSRATGPRVVLPLLLIVAPLGAQGQTPTTPPRSTQEPEASRPASQEKAKTSQEPIVVTATRVATEQFETPNATAVVSSEEIARRSYRTTPQALRNIPSVMVQETATGHGSPYIRGFTSFRNLFLVDGIRLNASFFRPGPNQYWNTVDPYSLDRIELVKGPSSVLYGSDAVGGTVQAFTRSPWTYGEGLVYGGSTLLRYQSAEDSITGRGEFSVSYTGESGRHTGLLVGGTIKRFGDLEGGRDTGMQPETGYDEKDLDLKAEHWLDDDFRLVFLHQRVRQDDVPRTHRTVNAISWRGTTVGSDLRRNFDQERQLTYLQLHADGLSGWFDSVHASISWHVQKENRDRIRGSGAQEWQGFDVGTIGAWFQLGSTTPVGRLTYGAEWYHDDVDSFFTRASTPQPGDDIQGPIADDATYDLIGVYLQDDIDVHERVRLTLGARFNYAAADADSVRDPVSNTRIGIDDDWSDFLGSARFTVEAVPDQVRVFGGVSQGFRAPNLSDLTRFDSARSNEFEIPAPGLDAENYIAYEIGVKLRAERASGELTYFYTDIEDQIRRFPTGNTNGAGETEITKANVGDGYVWGVELTAAWQPEPLDGTTVFGNATYMEGKVDNFPTAGSSPQAEYLTRLMPLTVQLGVRWEEPELDRFWAETMLVLTDAADKLSSGDVRDASRIPPGGTAGYALWDLRGGWHISENADLTIGVENITDADYRVHGSGQNRPGRGLLLVLSTRF